MILSTFKEDLEHQLERMLEEVIRDIKSVASSSPYGDRSRYKRDVEQLDQEIAELQVVLGQSCKQLTTFL